MSIAPDPTAAPCPHCGRAHDVSRRLHNDRVYCLCGGWFVVLHRPDGIWIGACDPPTSWPRERR